MTSQLQIPQVKLGDGKQIEQLGVGTYKLEPEIAYDIVSEALKLGYRHIDTAKLYNNEAAVGAAIKDSGVARSEIFVTTKLWHDDHLRAEAALNESLERLGLDYVDLFLIHWPVPKLGTALTAWKGLIAAREQGHTVSIGTSNFEIPHLTELLTETGVKPAVNQIEIHPEHQRRELIAFCNTQGIAVEAWSPLARGRESLLSSEAVVAAAKKYDKTPAQVILNWHLAKGYIVFPKTARKERLLENAGALEFKLTAVETAAIDALEKGARSGSDPFVFNG